MCCKYIQIELVERYDRIITYSTKLYIIYNNSGYCTLCIHSTPDTNNSVSVFVYLSTAIKRHNHRFTKSLPTNRKIKYIIS